MLADAHRLCPANACACESGSLDAPWPRRPGEPSACHLLELRQAQAPASPAPPRQALRTDLTPLLQARGSACLAPQAPRPVLAPRLRLCGQAVPGRASAAPRGASTRSWP